MEKSDTSRRGTVVRRILLVVAILVALMVGASIWYVNDYYHADDVAQSYVDNNNDRGVAVSTLAGGELAFVPEQPVAGLIFYPGGKVEPESYAPLMERCAELGILCVLVKPPFNLAILNPNAADGIREQFPDVTKWAVGGHSLGGVMAADYLSRHEDSVDGVVLLAAYTAADLSGFGGKALLVVGTNDQVLNREKYDGSRGLLPANVTEITVEGGNHAQFGNYGTQAGDGEASIPASEQQQTTARAIHDMLASVSKPPSP